MSITRPRGLLVLALLLKSASGVKIVDVALGKPVRETFSGSGENATAISSSPDIGWFSTAFSGIPDHTLYPETILVDLLDVFNVSAISFGAPAGTQGLPSNYSVTVGLPGLPYWISVDTESSENFTALPARFVRVVVTRVWGDGPNYTVAVPRLQVLGNPAPLSPPSISWPPEPRTPTPATPAGLRTERRINPIDVDVPLPWLSWELASTRQSDTVTAWQVIMNRSGATVWDSGIVPGTVFGTEAAPSVTFEAGDFVSWSVRLWDASGFATPWADPPATFIVAKLRSSDWLGEWIGANASLVRAGVFGPGHPAVYLRGSIDLPALAPTRAIASFSALGWGQLLVNGVEASGLELSPGYTTYEYRTQYNVMDVTTLLPQAGGKIVLAAVVADGWYALALDPSCCAHFQHQEYVNSTRMLLDLDVWFSDGSHLRLGSNASWQWSLGEISSSWFNGESVDKNFALPTDWASSFDHGNHSGATNSRLHAPLPWGSWYPVTMLDGPNQIFNGSVLTSQKEPPTLAGATLLPQISRSVSPDPWDAAGIAHIFDFGREVQGRPIVVAAANKTALLRILACGSLYLTGTLSCNESTRSALNTGDGPGQYNFTLAGTGDFETYSPRFTYAAIRRILVHAPEGVSVISATVQVVAMEQPRSGYLETSSDTYNWLHEALARTQVHYCTGFPNDPSRERVGYTQDTVNMFRGAAYEFASSENMYSRWAQDMADGQAYAYVHPGNGIPPGPGQMPTVIPGPKSDNANSVFWGGAMVWLPWRHFLHYGDVRILQRYYSNMIAYVQYLNASSPNHLVDWGLADWNSPLPECSGWGFHPDPINTPGLYLLSSVVADIAEFLGHIDDAARFAALAADTALAFNNAFLNSSTGQYAQGQQCHQVMALAMPGLVPASARSTAVEALMSRIAFDNTSLTVGFVSFLHELIVLADVDPALLHALITRRNYGPDAFTGGCVDADGPGGQPSTRPGCAPSPYSNSAGAFPSMDLMKESWQGGDAMMPSLSGPLLLHSYHTLAGIRSAETLSGAGFRNFTILPSPVPDLLWLNASYQSPVGVIAVKWFVAPAAGGENTTLFFLDVIVPPGATALVGVPCSSPVAAVGMYERHALVVLPGVTSWFHSDRRFFQVASGQYFFNTTLSDDADSNEPWTHWRWRAPNRP